VRTEALGLSIIIQNMLSPCWELSLSWERGKGILVVSTVQYSTVHVSVD
jgi:hypothetical protein